METVNKDQELELASVTLVDGLHFAEGSVGGVGAGPQPHRLLPVFDGWMHSHGCPLDPAEEAPTGEWPQRGSPGKPGRSTSEGSRRASKSSTK